MALLYLQEVSEIFNSSNSTDSNEEYVVETTTLPVEPATVAESLQTTRLVVQNVLTPVIVTIGLLGNFLNILVLFQPSMRTSTNVYLLVLSLADSVYLMFNFALSMLDCRKRGLSEHSYRFNPYGRFFSNFSGNVAVWITVVFTVERYIAVCHPIHGKVWCTVNRAKLASLAVFIVVLVNILPTIFELEVVESPTGLRCKYTEFASRFSYEVVYTWWYVTVFTFIPLVCLTIFNIVLIRALFMASRQRQQLALISSTVKSKSKENGKDKKNHHSSQSLHFSEPVSTTTYSSDRTSPTSATAALNHKRQSKKFSREQNKVTLLLVTIVMIFLLCQVPWTALYLYQTYLSSNNLSQSRTDLKIAGNVCNLLGLINASVNFYLYSCFSKRFRRTLAKLVMFWRRRHASPSNL